ncbi:hypothetical protein [Oceaniglobus indicus]|uniref:hypothetical protein n=1 Tax=Oceaniglobus indicus TaxID=2047749 RepID=UPI0011AB8A2B|nr:hypothetical protein [Oceaniglobus indicus]
MTIRMTAVTSALALIALTGAAAQAADTQWRAELKPLNAATAGSEASATATLGVSGDTLTIRIEASGTAPGVMHLQHFHGFTTGDGTSACPTGAADTNGDGIIDLIETEPGAGITMVPFHANPVSLAIVADSYPTAGADGTYAYEQSVSLAALEDAFGDAFPGQNLDFDRRVIFLHGVPADTDLPNSVQSLGDVPAHVTLPIACGTLDPAAD